MFGYLLEVLHPRNLIETRIRASAIHRDDFDLNFDLNLVLNGFKTPVVSRDVAEGSRRNRTEKIATVQFSV